MLVFSLFYLVFGLVSGRLVNVGVGDGGWMNDLEFFGFIVLFILGVRGWNIVY